MHCRQNAAYCTHFEMHKTMRLNEIANYKKQQTPNQNVMLTYCFIIADAVVWFWLIGRIQRSKNGLKPIESYKNDANQTTFAILE